MVLLWHESCSGITDSSYSSARSNVVVAGMHYRMRLPKASL